MKEQQKYQLDLTKKIMNYEGNQPTQMPLLSNNFMLDKLMNKIRLEGHLDDIIRIIQIVERRFPKYRDSWLYNFIFPGPSLLVGGIEDEFNKTPHTKELFKYLDLDKKEILWCNVIYCTTLSLAVISAIALKLALNGMFWSLWAIPLFALSIFLQLKLFEHTFKHIGFVQIYQQICDVLDTQYKEHCDYVKKVINFPEQVQQRWQEMEKNKAFDSMSAAEKQHRQELELKTAQSLQDLAGVVAIAQATTEAEVQEIKNKTQLNYRAAELKIIDQSEENKRRHEIALSALESMGRCLVEQAKAVATDSQEKQNIEYQLHLLNGIKSKLQSGGSAAMSDETIYESINKMMEMMSNPESTTGSNKS